MNKIPCDECEKCCNYISVSYCEKLLTYLNLNREVINE